MNSFAQHASVCQSSNNDSQWVPTSAAEPIIKLRGNDQMQSPASRDPGGPRQHKKLKQTMHCSRPCIYTVCAAPSSMSLCRAVLQYRLAGSRCATEPDRRKVSGYGVIGLRHHAACQHRGCPSSRSPGRKSQCRLRRYSVGVHHHRRKSEYPVPA